MDRIPIDKLNLEAYITDNPPAFAIRVRPGRIVVLTPEDGYEVRDALTDWLVELEYDADLRALEEARAADDGTRTSLRDFLRPLLHFKEGSNDE